MMSELAASVAGMAITEDSATPTTAKSQVLNITELLEIIISHLPCKDVLLAQRISKTWQATIAGSTVLQKGLFFIPSGQILETPGLCLQSGSATLTAEATKKTHKEIRVKKRRTRRQTVTPHEVYIRSAFHGWHFLNPMIKLILKLHKTEEGTVYAFERQEFGQTQHCPPWAKMYITQPPHTLLEVHRIPNRHAYRGSKEWEDNTIENPSGVTVGDLMRQLEERTVPGQGSKIYITFLGHLLPPEVNKD